MSNLESSFVYDTEVKQAIETPEEKVTGFANLGHYEGEEEWKTFEAPDSPCQFCGEGKAEIPMTDSETLEEVWICSNCNNEMEESDEI